MATPGGGKGRGMTWLLGGIVVGILGTVFVPRLAAPYLPDALRSEQTEVAGIVEAKSAEVDRLLLTIGSDSGAMLVTYRENVTEIDLLIDVGDRVVLVVDEYAPFVDDAKIRRVMKGDRTGVAESGDEASIPASTTIPESATDEPADPDIGLDESAIDPADVESSP